MAEACEKIFTYQRRLPETTPCYQIVQTALNTFVANRENEGRPLPAYVTEEFDAFLKCGILAQGFIRLQCADCLKDLVVAFSCKTRGFCPSCAGKRQAEAATHLTENILPLAPYRQFVVSFPIPLRYWLNANKKLFATVIRILTRQIHRHYKKRANDAGIDAAETGSIAFVQRWGSAANLNPHCHLLCLDGVFKMNGPRPKFANVSPFTDADCEALLTLISRKIMNHLRRKGYLDSSGEVTVNPDADPLFAEHESLAAATASSIAGKIAFGPNTGRYVTKIGSGFGYDEEIPLAKGKLCYAVNGFSLHAATATKTLQRGRLYNLIEYMARGPIANKRLEITKAGLVKLQLKTPWHDGTSHLLFTKEEFLGRLTALIPPPRAHLVKWAGVFRSNHKRRREIILTPGIKKADRKSIKENTESDAETPAKPRNSQWSKLLAKTFNIDTTKCPHCGGRLHFQAAILDTESIQRFLTHQGLDPRPPPRSPAKYEMQSLQFEGGHHDD